MKYLLLSMLMVMSSATLAANATSTAKDCMIVETKDGFTLLTNKCETTVNAFWVYEGECAAGCTKKFAARAYYYVPLLKEPYSMAACFSPEQVDPNWKGFGVATCK